MDWKVVVGDCADVLKGLPADSVSLIVSSPPYSDLRKHAYASVPADQYLDWVRPIGAELFRVLKPDGSFVLNIKEPVVDGQRHPFVLKLILALIEEQGWRWVDEYVWLKNNARPGDFGPRFRDAWERLLHFAKAPDLYMDKDAVRVPAAAGSVRKGKLERANKEARGGGKRRYTRTASGLETELGIEYRDGKCYPDNVLRVNVESWPKTTHAAVFPIQIPDFFIRLLSRPGDLILDPFCGSGTTLEAAFHASRSGLGIDVDPEAVAFARERVGMFLTAGGISKASGSRPPEAPETLLVEGVGTPENDKGKKDEGLFCPRS